VPRLKQSFLFIGVHLEFFSFGGEHHSVTVVEILLTLTEVRGFVSDVLLSLLGHFD